MPVVVVSILFAPFVKFLMKVIRIVDVYSEPCGNPLVSSVCYENVHLSLGDYFLFFLGLRELRQGGCFSLSVTLELPGRLS